MGAAYRLECSMFVPLPIEQVFAVFGDPRNLARITPASLGFEIVSSEPRMRRGAEIEYRIRWAGLPLSWKTLITAYEPPNLFIDEQIRGPYRLWRHRHMFRAAEGGTEIADQVDYALPFGILGRAAHALAVRRQLNGIFSYRQEALARMLGDPARTRYTLPVITEQTDDTEPRP
jgi:ligand-binding SRPBCC domain-containing protein